MTDRDKAYLVAHNKRRMEWHAYYGKQYVPLKWSRGEFSVYYVHVNCQCIPLTSTD
jgi:hypothetical protein